MTEITGIYSMDGEMRNVLKNLSRKLEGKRPYKRLSINQRMMLKYNIGKCRMRLWAEFN